MKSDFTKFAIYDPTSKRFLSSEPSVYDQNWTDQAKKVASWVLIENAMDTLKSVHYNHHKPAIPDAFIVEVTFTMTTTLEPANKVVEGAVNKHLEKHTTIYEELLPQWLAEKMKPVDYDRFIASRRVLIDAGIPVMRDNGKLE